MIPGRRLLEEKSFFLGKKLDQIIVIVISSRSSAVATVKICNQNIFRVYFLKWETNLKMSTNVCTINFLVTSSTTKKVLKYLSKNRVDKLLLLLLRF
jgi:hypothetical protein